MKISPDLTPAERRRYLAWRKRKAAELRYNRRIRYSVPVKERNRQARYWAGWML